MLESTRLLPRVYPECGAVETADRIEVLNLMVMDAKV
jgi:hypothetical protein